jgi:hypothetical protein
MASAPVRILGAVIKLVERQANAWTTEGAIPAFAAAGASTSSTSSDSLAEARAALDIERQKLCDGSLAKEDKDEQIAAALIAGVRGLFRALCEPLVLKVLSRSGLAGSTAMDGLDSLRKALKAPTESLAAAPGEAVRAALPAIQRGGDTDGAKQMIDLLSFVVDEVFEKAWGIEDPWGDHKVGGSIWSPLALAADADNVVLTSIALDRENPCTPPSASQRAAIVAALRPVFPLGSLSNDFNRRSLMVLRILQHDSIRRQLTSIA